MEDHKSGLRDDADLLIVDGNLHYDIGLPQQLRAVLLGGRAVH